MTVEKTLILVKHDGVSRGLIGKIVSRFEGMGLKICAMKMVWADEELAGKHYKLAEEWAVKMYERTKKAKEETGEEFPYKDALEYGGMIRSWNMKFLQEGPVVAIVIEGPHAVEIVRKTLGATEPRQANPGTIRGDFASVESYKLADVRKRVLRNLVHGSDTPENAKHEISLWFNKEEIHSYSKDLDRHH